MLTAEIKNNDKLIAVIEAQNVKTLSDRPGDFIGDRATICEYKCDVTTPGQPDQWRQFTVVHDRRFGWPGLFCKIAEQVIPPVVETTTEDKRKEWRDLVGGYPTNRKED